jgi:hypothetical protein
LQAIQERIRSLEFQDCKVRVSNVDSQSSFDNIVIQVIGETSNKSAELKKFVQTFVLAQQPTGYFVLNDIFRYIKDEPEDEIVNSAESEEAAPLSEDVEMPKAPAEEEAPPALDADVVAKKLEETIEQPATPEPATNGTSEPAAEVEDVPAAAAEEAQETPSVEEVEKEVTEEEIKQEEKPKDPVPSPVAPRVPSPAKPTPPAQPAGPPKPLSWASRAAAAVGSAPKPAVPALSAPKTATPPAQPRAAAPAKSAAAPSQPAPASTPAATPSSEKENVGWQTAGDHVKRQNRPQSISAPPEDKGTMAYIRNVTEKLTSESLRGALESFGPLVYFDINRAKVLYTPILFCE